MGRKTIEQSKSSWGGEVYGGKDFRERYQPFEFWVENIMSDEHWTVSVVMMRQMRLDDWDEKSEK